MSKKDGVFYKVWDLDRSKWWVPSGSSGRRMGGIWSEIRHIKASMRGEAGRMQWGPYYQHSYVPKNYRIMSCKLTIVDEIELVIEGVK